jgi:hypothetical protein
MMLPRIPRIFEVGERVVFKDPVHGLVRGTVERLLIVSAVVYFPRLGRELIVPMRQLRPCPVDLAYCRPPRGVA